MTDAELRIECVKVASECAADRFSTANVVNFATVLYDWVVSGGAADTPHCPSVERSPAPPLAIRKRKDKA